MCATIWLRRVQGRFGAHAEKKLKAQDPCVMALKKQFVDDEPNVEYKYELIPLVELTYEEAFAQFDHAARRRLNMSGEDFLKKWRANAFSEEFMDEHHSAFAVLSLLAAPFGK
jgi:hypothetical protein